MENKSKKPFIIAVAAIVIIGFGLFYFFYYEKGIDSLSQSVKNVFNDQLPPPPILTGDQRFEILSIKDGGFYSARDAANKKVEMDLFIPSDAKITGGNVKSVKKGTVIVVTKSMQVTNGLVALELEITK